MHNFPDARRRNMQFKRKLEYYARRCTSGVLKAGAAIFIFASLIMGISGQIRFDRSSCYLNQSNYCQYSPATAIALLRNQTPDK
jgi:hypothetical protein